MAFPTNLAPIVGQQITLARSSSAAVAARVDLLRQRADAGECDLVAKTTAGGDDGDDEGDKAGDKAGDRAGDKAGAAPGSAGKGSAER
jgi:hypothetical protein